MNKLLFYVIIVITFALSACGTGNDKLNSARLRELISQALNKNHDANVELKGLIDAELINRKDFNSIRIDSGYINRKYCYSVLLEHFDPSLNRFAIYDDQLRLYLIDKSLNGNLSVEWIEKENRNFIFLQERFLTKDVLSMDRLSIYEVYDTTAGLVYRSISRLVKENIIYSQTIESISPDFIITKISGITDPKTIAETDTFYFFKTDMKYLSTKDLFSNFVKKEVEDFRWITIKPQIPSKE
ncbi:MAG: hypothetical protein HXY48_13855 [Ignavibacteriaceae bacterium]|nr:hypothetical protein [Ignavibacteriaceae bacterium]